MAIPSKMNACCKGLLVLVYVSLCKGRTVKVSHDNCEGTYISFDNEPGPIYLNYESLKLDEPCVYAFHKSDYSDDLCVEAVAFKVTSRQLKVEYHGSVYYSNTADETYGRDNYPIEEYCKSFSHIYVAFVSPYTGGYDDVRLKVYLKKGMDAYVSIPSTALIVGLPIGIMVFILSIAVIGIICQRRYRRNRENIGVPYEYRHAGNGPNSVTYLPAGNSNHPVPIQQQAGYNVYPTQVAYPVGQEPAGTRPLLDRYQCTGVRQGSNVPAAVYPTGPGSYPHNPSSTGPSSRHEDTHNQEIDPSAPPPPYPGY